MKIYIPLDTTAVAKGADSVALACDNAIGSSGIDAHVIRNGSHGLFWLEPLLEIESEDDRFAFGPVTAEDATELVLTLAAGGRLADHPKYLGETADIPYLKEQQRLTFERVGYVDPLDLDDYEQRGGLIGLKKALRMTPEEIVEEVTDSGLRGRGGAAFPTGIKWKTTLHQPSETKFIICNADEGDSGTFADRMLMEGDPFTLIEGMVIAGLATGATYGYIYTRSEYPVACRVFREAIRIANDAGLLGDNVLGSRKTFQIEFRMGAGAYICGEETSLMESIEGKRGLVRSKPPIPAIEGLFGQPTVVNNVISLASVPIILAKGAAYYRDYGLGRSRGTIPVQLAGNIKQGGLVEIAFGTTLRDLIYKYGGGSRSGRQLVAAQVGGPLGAYIPEQEWDIELDYEAFAAVKAVVGHGGVVVFDDQVDMSEMARFSMEFCAVESCGKCTPCRIGAVRGMEVIDALKSAQDKESALNLLHDLCDTMEEGSLCAMGGMTPFPVRSIVKHFPESFGLPANSEASGKEN